MPTIEAQWRGLVFEDDLYRISNLTGWEGLPSPRIEDTARPNAHGSFGTPVWSGARTVVLEGYCVSLDLRDQLMIDLGSVATLDGDDPAEQLAITFANRTLYANAQISGYDPTLKNWGVGNWGWQVQFRCADPFRYGPPQQGITALPSDLGGMEFDLFDTTGLLEFGVIGVPGRVDVTNAGTAEAWPTFEVTGPLAAGFELVEVTTGKRLRWAATVPAGVTVSLESRTGAVSYDGVSGYDGTLTKRQWWSVPKGQTRTVQFVALGTPDPAAQLSVTWSPTYW